MEGQVRKIPEHEAIYRRIRDAILFGELVPGQAVTIHGLELMIGAGMTPVREAIRRLTSEGALSAMSNRRIEVPRLTSEQVDELAVARLAVEPELAFKAMTHCDNALIAELSDIDKALDGAIASGSIEGYLTHNHAFHFTLYRAANADILMSIAKSLWMRAGPSLRVVCGRFGTANLPDMHDRAIDALRKRDAEALRIAIHDDIAQGLDQIRMSLAEAPLDEGD